MAKFCTQCGTPSEDSDARFCQSCGAPLPASIAPQIASPPVNASRPAPALPLARIARIAAAGVAFLALLGGGVWFMTKVPSAPDASSLATLLNADVKTAEQHVCMGNFPYDKDPVFISYYDAPSKNLLDLLVRAGIYNRPETQVSNGWIRQLQYKYTHTPLGLKAVKNGKLCFAEGIAIDKVEYLEPKKVNDKTYVEAKYTYHYANPAAWINAPELKVLDAQHFGQSSFDNRASLALEDGKWKLISGQAVFNSGSSSERASAQAYSPPPSAGFINWLNNLFSSMGGNPLIGKWEFDSEGMGIAGVNLGQQLEFSADEMRKGSSVYKIKYEVRGNEVLVTETNAHNPADTGTTFTVVDHDHIVLDTGMVKYNFRRMN